MSALLLGSPCCLFISGERHFSEIDCKGPRWWKVQLFFTCLCLVQLSVCIHCLHTLSSAPDSQAWRPAAAGATGSYHHAPAEGGPQLTALSGVCLSYLLIQLLTAALDVYYTYYFLTWVELVLVYYVYNFFVSLQALRLWTYFSCFVFTSAHHLCIWWHFVVSYDFTNPPKCQLRS